MTLNCPEIWHLLSLLCSVSIFETICSTVPWNSSPIPYNKNHWLYLTVILRGRAGYELIYITNEAVGRVGYYQLISGKSEKNNCFSKFSSNALDFSGETSSNRDIFFTEA